MINAWNRREFLKTASQATLAALAAGAPMSSLLTSCAGSKPIDTSTADTVILLWMALQEQRFKLPLIITIQQQEQPIIT